MLQLVLAVSVVVVAVAVYGGLGLRWWWRARLRRGILARVAALDLEPYHAAALKQEKTEAAAAELMLGGYLEIDGEGAARLTEAGREAGRIPVEAAPAALLEAVRRHDPEPVSIGWIRQPWACCGCVGFVLLVCFWLLVAEMLVIVPPHGLREWSAAVVAAAGLAALWFAPAGGRAVRARTECGDALGDRLRTAVHEAAETHPAMAALDERQRLHVLTSAGDRDRWRGVDGFVPDEDEGEGEDESEDDDEDEDEDEWWGWVDAYHYRAADHEDGPDGS
ncbi:hypothetical protein [Streptomyces avidinii]|uniref:TIGR04222 domain-containing membrane protein n=1 Tax=Streptomyces avidinii TaxID=1895 RepID=A0ABS4L4T0_STRAV|nr:hypothetical protein [Streptomyces avidinii]MBP2037105.1 hypothetical protein [Streptomyces avidinii]GGY95213.1 hypothetical protein GCM10010343_20830 [Streptomyces avidinii]